MTKGKPTDIAASIRQKLLNLAEKTGYNPNFIWSRYAIERLLYRLSISEFSEEFVLKGANLFMIWFNEPHRPTMDLDLLGYGEDSNEHMADIFQRICRMNVENDGLTFNAESIRVMPIREEMEYHGRRVNLLAYLGQARIPVQVDIGFGDVVTPKAEMIGYPTLLKMPAPRIRACPQPTVIAEKFHAMVILGIANSRMKDFYDLYMLANRFAFDGAVLVKAVKATFRRRKTAVPSNPPMALTEEFNRDHMKNIQWNAFVRRSGANQKVPGFLKVLSLLRDFLLPIMNAAADQCPFQKNWEAGGPWNT
ncbi:MAG: nucleotidyl transferase AbiEii/AbiGii toxin family protein [Planctomycetota bacterium]